VVYSDEFVAGWWSLCERKSLYLIMDDTYKPSDFRRARSQQLLPLQQGPDHRQLQAGGRQLRVEDVCHDGFSDRLDDRPQGPDTSHDQHTVAGDIGPAAPSQWAAVGALTGVQSCIESLRLTLENNRNVMMTRLEAFAGVRAVRPGGTFLLFSRLQRLRKDSQKLSRFLLDKVRVVTVPGKEFGMEGHLRLSYCGTVKEVTEGIERIQVGARPELAQRVIFWATARL